MTHLRAILVALASAATACSVADTPPKDERVAAGGSSLSGPNPWPTANKGIYALNPLKNQVPSDIYSNPVVTGLALGVAWSDIETSDGYMDFSALDARIQDAQTNGKKISLNFAGWLLPDWLRLAGAPSFAFYDRNPNHPLYCEPGHEPTCTALYMPVPWNATFLRQFKAFVAAVGAHYAGNTAISFVGGASESVTNGWGMPSVDINNRTWFDPAYQYTSEKLLSAMTQLVDAYRLAFPNVPLWTEVGAIPFDTAPNSPHTPVWVAQQITSYGFANYPNHFGTWREDIYACTPNPPDPGTYWDLLHQHPGRNGAQMLQAVVNTSRVQGGDPTSCLPGTPTPQQILQAAVDVAATGYRMPYMEIYVPDLESPDLQTILANASTRLKQ